MFSPSTKSPRSCCPSSPDRTDRFRPRRAARAAAVLLRAYRLVVSPLLGPACRFAPSCSRYAEAAIARHGLVAGGKLAVRRIARCHPWNPGGYDPVPPAVSS